LLLVLFFVLVCSGQNFVRVYYNYPANAGVHTFVDYDPQGKTVLRVAGMTLPGNPAIVINSGYLTADENNVWGYQTNTEFNNLQLTTMFSHSSCLADTVPVGNNALSAVALDPLHQWFYLTYQNIIGIGRYNFDGTNFVKYSYGFSGNYQLQLDYMHNRAILLPSPAGISFNIFDLTTNGTTSVNLTAGISGGIALDINFGRLYIATQIGIVSYDPATTITATVYTNADLVFRGITIDTKNGLMFFIADRMSKKDSQIFVIPINLPLGTTSGTPTPLQATTPGTFSTMALAHCTPATCGKCGFTIYAPTTNPATTLTTSVFLLLCAFLIVLL